ncbi:unnamed protein product [Prorocentrum cordatum]|uniref:Uncharacterized protein n=1 Tax=Prorocentrum cordatum TaxID=2364126 RepID=A0ABN9R755_9DINO|nr:unnamed protein product [Polarella glacialis]
MEVDSAEYEELIDAVGRAARLEPLSRERFYKVDFVEASPPAPAEEMGKLVKKGALHVHCCRSVTSECKALGPAGAATLHCGGFGLWLADGGPDREGRRKDEGGGRLAEKLKANIRELKGPTSVHDRLIEGAIVRASRHGRKEPAAGTARRQLAVLLTALLKKIHTYLGRMGDGEDPYGLGPLVDTHLAAVLLPASGGRGLRNTRELKTLALAIDHLLSGRICEAGDLLAPRFRAVEASRQEGWAVARHLEAIGGSAVSSLTDREREVAARQENEDRKFKGLVAKAKARPG